MIPYSRLKRSDLYTLSQSERLWKQYPSQCHIPIIIAHIWQYPPPPQPGAQASLQGNNGIKHYWCDILFIDCNSGSDFEPYWISDKSTKCTPALKCNFFSCHPFYQPLYLWSFLFLTDYFCEGGTDMPLWGGSIYSFAMWKPSVHVSVNTSLTLWATRLISIKFLLVKSMLY